MDKIPTVTSRIGRTHISRSIGNNRMLMRRQCYRSTRTRARRIANHHGTDRGRTRLNAVLMVNTGSLGLYSLETRVIPHHIRKLIGKRSATRNVTGLQPLFNTAGRAVLYDEQVIGVNRHFLRDGRDFVTDIHMDGIDVGSAGGTGVAFFSRQMNHCQGHAYGQNRSTCAGHGLQRDEITRVQYRDEKPTDTRFVGIV